jgi:hypothetical protein
MNRSLFHINWDKFGIAASVACAIHCAVLPLFLTSLPVFGINLLQSKAFEYFMIGLAAFVGIFSLTHGFRWHHHRLVPISIFVGGIGLLVVRELMGTHPLWATIGAVSMIVLAHYLNYRYCRKANHCHTSDCNH